MDKPNCIRKIDELGRVVIPIEIRKILEIKERDSLGIYLNDTGIFIKKEAPSCVFCSSDKNLRSFYGKDICEYCIKKLK